jgi:hypothetical protein
MIGIRFSEVAVIGIDIRKNSFHVVDLDARGAIQLRQKWSRGQTEGRLANYPNFSVGDSVSRRGAGLLRLDASQSTLAGNAFVADGTHRARPRGLIVFRS